ncbi:MAG: lasso peptide biosynthesis B2 protein [Methanobacterium sp.]
MALQSLFWVLCVRLMIWIFPFHQVQKRVQKKSSSSSRKDSKPDPGVPIHRIRFMIQMAARYVPSSTCLVQALAGHILFSKYGYTTLIKIGVLNQDGQFEAHAWLEHDDDVVLGESEKDFKTILDIEG